MPASGWCCGQRCYPVVDAHTHLAPDGCKDSFSSAAAAIDYLRAAGTDAALFTPVAAIYTGDAATLAAANAYALELWRAYPDFVYPGVTIHPALPELSLEWLARFRDEGLLWVGEMVPSAANTVAFDAPAYMRLFEVCARHGHIVQLHNVPGSIAAVARRLPELSVVQAHVMRESLDELAALPNVCMDISGKVAGIGCGGLAAARTAFGAERLLYGSDFMAFEPRCFQLQVDLVFPEPERPLIYGGNVQRLLAAAGARPLPVAALPASRKSGHPLQIL